MGLKSCISFANQSIEFIAALRNEIYEKDVIFHTAISSEQLGLGDTKLPSDLSVSSLESNSNATPGGSWRVLKVKSVEGVFFHTNFINELL